MRTLSLTLGCVAALSLFASSADAGLTAFMTLRGQKGDIKGSVTQKGREGQMAVIEYSHEIVSPRDAASGLPTGKPQHKALVIRKEIDKASPALRNALVSNENLPELVLRFWTPQPLGRAGTGAETNHFTVKLTNAKISAVKMVLPNVKDPSLMRYAEYEEISFTYQKIQWTWESGGLTAQDDWQSPIR